MYEDRIEEELEYINLKNLLKKKIDFLEEKYSLNKKEGPVNNPNNLSLDIKKICKKHGIE
jgi:hypothetical protein